MIWLALKSPPLLLLVLAYLLKLFQFFLSKCSFCVYRSQVILHFRLKGRLGIMPILQLANFGILSDRNNVSFS